MYIQEPEPRTEERYMYVEEVHVEYLPAVLLSTTDGPTTRMDSRHEA